VTAHPFRILAGLIGSFVFGGAIALGMARSRSVERLFSPMLFAKPARSWQARSENRPS
jgi:ABC-type nitrate/sulfonate/bicarbonate transport system permease component